MRRLLLAAVLGVAGIGVGVGGAAPASAEVCVTVTVYVNGVPSSRQECQPLLDQWPSPCVWVDQIELGHGARIEVCAPAPV